MQVDIYFQKCEEDDFKQYYTLKCDRENIIWAGHKIKPDKNKFREWFLEQLKRQDRIIFLAKAKEFPRDAIGYLYLDIIGENLLEISYGVNSKYKGKGIGTKIVKFALDYSVNNLPLMDTIIAWVAYNNIGSIKVLEKNKYIKTNKTKKVFFKAFEKELTMRKYIYRFKR